MKSILTILVSWFAAGMAWAVSVSDGPSSTAAGASTTVASITAVMPPQTIGTNNVINWALGFVFTQTSASSNATYTFTGEADGQDIVVELVNTNNAGVITWPTSLGSWGYTNAMSIGSNKTAVVTFKKIGTNTYGVVQSFR